ncbi:thiol-disulfide oxidoreductase DCC family protein [Demequina phytophila]|uniref:thiol-disulfide oxidoreductase DCC family protein n=1 Tax=Demequina phytophila TaxID=1638981 RepID=UPI000783D3A1|nr:DCC1-like thiol-disulfide oxidoreductase family protein [Demequina phytophila]
MRALVIFDGDCGLCNGFVAWLITHDPHRCFLIAGSAGEPGRAALEAAGLGPEIAASTIVVWDGREALVRTDALARIARGLPWPWRAAAAMRVVPHALRDAAYDQVARRRPRRPADDPACGMPPRDLLDLWRSRLATVEVIAALAASRTPST